MTADGEHDNSKVSGRKKVLIAVIIIGLLVLGGTAYALTIDSSDDGDGDGEAVAEDYAVIFNPLEWVGAVPASGSWSFKLTGTGSNFTGAPERCPIGVPGGFSSSGTADLIVSADGGSATMLIDNQTLSFTGQPENYTNFYRTGTSTFPVEGGMGTIYFDFVANTYDTIVGTIHWNNNQGCSGDYAFTMELVEIE